MSVSVASSAVITVEKTRNRDTGALVKPEEIIVASERRETWAQSVGARDVAAESVGARAVR